MKKKVLCVICLISIVVVISYTTAILRVESKSLWVILFLIVAFLSGLFTKRYAQLKLVLIAMLMGVLVVHIPWWIKLHIENGIKYSEFIYYFFKGTNMFYSIVGIIAGCSLYKLTDWIRSRKC